MLCIFSHCFIHIKNSFVSNNLGNNIACVIKLSQYISIMDIPLLLWKLNFQSVGSIQRNWLVHKEEVWICRNSHQICLPYFNPQRFRPYFYGQSVVEKLSYRVFWPLGNDLHINSMVCSRWKRVYHIFQPDCNEISLIRNPFC